MTLPTASPDSSGAHAPPSVESITRLVHGFYGDVRQDPLLGPVFEKALHGQWDAHLQRLVDFWSTVALGTRSFKGDVFGKHMAHDSKLEKLERFAIDISASIKENRCPFSCG